MTSSLRDYKKKRDFSKTAEPSGDTAAPPAPGLRYVVQKHDATRLHYDFRLEVDGVLKSWAVPKGPSLDPADKRLAVQTEDHPLAYGGFEGTIPEGEYGGGPVLLWDEGTYVPEGDAKAAIEKGRFSFVLDGKKLKGKFHLVRLKGEAKQPQWLLIKSGDDHVVRGRGVDDIDDTSVKTGRTIEEVAQGSQVPALVEPELCTPVSEPPPGEQWLHEPKIDGYRILARKDGDDVKLFTRTGLDWTERFPDVAKAVKKLPRESVLLDGEVAVLDEKGASSFQALQRAIADADKKARVVFFVFDCLFVDGRDLRRQPLLERKQELSSLLVKRQKSRSAALEQVPWVIGHGDELLARMTAQGLEGIISKRVDSLYQSARTRDWLKLRLSTHEEFVVIGYTPLKKGGDGIGALLIATVDDLQFRGKVGTGYTDKDRAELLKMLQPLERRSSAVTPRPKVPHAVWVEPEVVVEVEYMEITGDGSLRHPAYLGIRRDKTKGPHVPPASGGRAPLGSSRGPSDVVAGIKITHPERELFRVGAHALTKLDAARYIEAVAPLMLPHVSGRPLACVRCPDGSTGQCFFQKHTMRGMPKSIEGIDVGEKDNKKMLVVHDAAGLVGLVQMGTLEFHCWGSMPDEPERPDRVVFDLDPVDGLPWSRVVQAAREIRARLSGFATFVKTTGGKGLHVVLPLDGSASWEEVRTFARAVAEQMERDQPKIYTANLRKAAREGRVFVDHLRNGRGATAIAPFSMRSRPGAPVAVPVSWDELDDVRGDSWSMLTLHERIATTEDPWADYFTSAQDLAGKRASRRRPPPPHPRGPQRARRGEARATS